ncbi:MAG TPA: hypothetical protein VGR69_04175 [Candidatus Rubrimentiphilum sp.]|nr:hypothetical protein [Candidatus Rubrimentiphilum sp.]
MKRANALLVFAIAAAGMLTVAAAAPTPKAPAALSKMEWRNIGPFIGGRSVAVAGVPGRNLFYMGAVGGGVWKSTDYGLTWTNITDGQLPLGANSIGALAVAPSNSNVIYAGSGEADIRGTFITGEGLYRSSDAGKTWHYAGLRDTHTIGAIAVHPSDPNIVYVASMGHVFADNADRGVLKSTDGGTTWTKVLFVNGATGAIDVVMDPKHPQTLYASMWQAYRRPWKLSSGGPGSGLYKTTDGGAHWNKISTHPGFARSLLGKMGVAVSASNPSIVYAIVQARDGGVFRSTNGGASWTRVNSDYKLRQRAFYYMGIFVDPTNSNTVYAPNVDACFVSHNGGVTWSRLRPPHGDNHIVWIDPRNPNILLEGNDGGATVSTDGGKTRSQEHNQPTGQFYHVAIDRQFPFHVYGAQQDEGSIEGPNASYNGAITSDDWHGVAYGESTFIAPQPGDPNITYGSGYYSIFLRYDMRTGEYRSVSPWPNYTEGGTSAEMRYRLAWTHPIFFSPANPHELLVGAQYVLRSTNDGLSWQRISPDLTRNDPRTQGPTGGPIDLDQTSAEVFPYISALAVSPVNGATMWAGSSDGLVHVTTDNGAHWRSITPPALPQWAEITSIEPSHTQAGTAFLTASRYQYDDFRPYVFRTNDYGATWTAITGGLPDDEYVYVVRQDGYAPDLLFLGTRNTVYSSFDGGTHWQPLTLNLPGVQVRDIQIDSPQGAFAIATHGRAFWVLDNLWLIEQVATGMNVSSSAPQLFGPQTAWLTHYFGGGGFPRSDSGANPPFGASVFFNVPTSYNGSTPVTLTFSDSAGHVIRSFALHTRAKNHPKLTPAMRERMTPSQIKAANDYDTTTISAGMNRFQWDLRYPDATEVTGFYIPVAAGGEEDTLQGPEVIPGQYNVMLDYGGTQIKRAFTVSLDLNLHPAPGGLAARLALLQRIHNTVDTLNKTINEALATRNRLARSNPRSPTVAALNAELAKLVQLNLKSSEGDVLHETKLRDHLAYLASDIDFAYDAPTQAQYSVYDQLRAQAAAGEQTLRGLISRANLR